MFKILFLLITTLLFTSCGGGGGSSSTSLFSGQFIDAKVQGLTYNCSSGMSGVTDSEGTFTCHDGDSISFYIGNLFLGTTQVAPIITPYSLWNDTETAVNVAQALQTLDQNSTNDEVIVLGTINLDDLNISSTTFDGDFDNNTTQVIVTNTLAQNSMDVSIAINSLDFDDIKNSNTIENYITTDLTLITSGEKDTTISWDSSSLIYLSNTGTVTRPTYTQGTQNITLNATVSKNGLTQSKNFFLSLPTLSPLNDTESVEYDITALDFNNIKINNTLQTEITSNLNLLLSGENNTTISWESNDTIHLTTQGIVTRPHFNLSDINVTLTSTVTKGNQSQSKTIIVTIKALDTLDADNDFIPDNIEQMLGLDSTNGDENQNGIADGIDGSFGDTFYLSQWHIKSRGTIVNNINSIASIIGNDLSLDNVYKTYMGYNSGNPIIVSVVDNGTDAYHEDLVDNMDFTRSRNAVTGTTNPTPTGDELHGTLVAGIIAARGFNGKGVRGVAPFAKIAANNWLSNQTYVELEKAWVTGSGTNEIAVCNNSWGSEYDNDTIMEDILKVGATTLRDGKGTIYVKASGNDRNDRGNSNLSNSSNNRYIIAVSALKHDNTYASYSSYGSNILISGYSGDYYNTAPTIGTTNVSGDSSLPTWSGDINYNYTYAMNGTSAAAPTVSGSIALIIEACPTLTYRDIKYIIAKTAKKVDNSNLSWIQNNSGLWHSIDYGYGLINTENSINMCKNGYTNLTVEKSSTNTINFNQYIPDDNQRGKSFTIPISKSLSIEWIGVYVDISSHPYQGDLEIFITSPSGTKTKLIQGNNILKSAGEYTSGFYNGNGRLSSVAFIDENSYGDWTVTVKDLALYDAGMLENIKLEIIGH